MTTNLLTADKLAARCRAWLPPACTSTCPPLHTHTQLRAPRTRPDVLPPVVVMNLHSRTQIMRAYRHTCNANQNPRVRCTVLMLTPSCGRSFRSSLRRAPTTTTPPSRHGSAAHYQVPLNKHLRGMPTRRVRGRKVLVSKKRTKNIAIWLESEGGGD
jgi:hypothetical protein